MTLLKTILILSPVLAAAPLSAQIARNVPTGNPLGAVPIVVPGGGQIETVPVPDGTALLQQQQQAAAERARALSLYRARQAALAESARPMPSNNTYIDLGRAGDQQRAAQAGTTEPARPSGGMTSAYGGIPNIFAGGIHTPWAR